MIAIDHATREKHKSDITKPAKNNPAFHDQEYWFTDPDAKDSTEEFLVYITASNNWL